MKSLILFLLISQIAGLSVTIPPLKFLTKTTPLTERNSVHYQVNSSSSVSVFIMDSYQYYQFKNNEPFTYDYNCSKLCVTSANVSCIHYVDFSYHLIDYLVYFVIQNDLNNSVDVSYILEYTEDQLLLLLGWLAGGILAIIVIPLGVHFIRKRCTPKEIPNYDYMIY